MALTAAALAAIYLPALNAPLIWDDKPTIVFNRALTQPHPWRDYVTPRYYAFSGEATWRPVTTIVTRGLAILTGERPWAMRAAGLALHSAAAFLLAALLTDLGLDAATSALAAALFLLCPLATETLMCVSFNEELLVATLGLSMLLAHRRGRLAAAWAAFAVGLLCKESGLMLLPAAALLDAAAPSPRARRGALYGGYLALAAAYVWMRFGVMAVHRAADLSAGAEPSARLLRAAGAVGVAGRLFALPYPLRLDYPAVPAPAAAAASQTAAAGAAAAAVWLAAVSWTWRRQRPLAALAAWPALFLAPVLDLVPADVLGARFMAERWLYLPSLGVCAVAAAALKRRRAAALALLGAWAALTWTRAQDWRDEVRLWSRQAALEPSSSAAFEAMGKAYLSRDELAPARAALERALRLRDAGGDPLLAGRAWSEPTLYHCLGLIAIRQGRFTEARELLSRGWAVAPSAFCAKALAFAAAKSGRYAEAARWSDAGLSLAPTDAALQALRAASRRRQAPPELAFGYAG